MKWSFVGKAGIRAGWSICIFLAIVVAVAIVEVAAVVAFGRRPSIDVPAPGPMFVVETLQCLPVIAATVLMGLIEKRPFRSYGYGGGRVVIKFLGGAAVGLIAMGSLVGTLWLCHLLVFKGFAIHGPETIGFGLFWAATFCLVGVFEESLFRGYVQATLTRGINFWWGACITSALFVLAHATNPGETPLGLLAVGAAGLTFALSLRLTGSLWWAIGSHMAWDWAQSFLFGVADSGMVAKGCLLMSHPAGSALLSGGATGPEGSLFVLPVLALMCLWLWLRWRKATPPPAS